MTTRSARKLFVNLPVRDLARSMAFFTELGFEFNRQFTNEQGACMVVSEEVSVMLLTEPFFQTFTAKKIGDTGSQTEGIFALSCVDRAEVDTLVKRALAAGGKPAMPPQDQDLMYGHSFYDLDGHHWEVFWMDPNFVQK
jgi:uncharacterized protein